MSARYFLLVLLLVLRAVSDRVSEKSVWVPGGGVVHQAGTLARVELDQRHELGRQLPFSRTRGKDVLNTDFNERNPNDTVFFKIIYLKIILFQLKVFERAFNFYINGCSKVFILHLFSYSKKHILLVKNLSVI